MTADVRLLCDCRVPVGLCSQLSLTCGWSVLVNYSLTVDPQLQL